MKSIIEREATFESNSDMEVKVTHTKLSQAFIKEKQWSKACSTVKSTWQAKHRGGVSPRSKCPRVRYVCSILNLWTIISTPKFNHITPIPKSLHWLKINERIKYKVLSLIYKSLKTGQPSYLRSLLSFPTIVVLGLPLLSPLVALLSPLVLK